MLAAETPDIVLRELRDKVQMTNVVAAIGYAASGLVTAPFFLLAKKASVVDFLTGIGARVGLPIGLCELLAGPIVLWFVFDVVEARSRRHAAWIND